MENSMSNINKLATNLYVHIKKLIWYWKEAPQIHEEMENFSGRIIG